MLLPLLLVGLVVLVIAAGGLYLLGLQNGPAAVGGSSPSAMVTAGATASPSPTPVPGPVDADWITVGPKGAGFSARFPGEPKAETSTTKTDVGTAATSTWMYEVNAREVYAVFTMAYPSGAFKGVASSFLFDSETKALASMTSDATLVSQSDTKMKGHPGRTFLVQDSTGAMKGAMYLVGSKLYLVYAAYPLIVDTAGVDAFLADFKLTV